MASNMIFTCRIKTVIHLSLNKSTGNSKYIVYNVTANTTYFIVVNGSESSSNNYSSMQNYSLDLRSINYSYSTRTSYAGTTNIDIDISALPSPHYGYFTKAMNDWNSGTVHFAENSASKNKAYTDRYDDGWYGLYTSYTQNQSFKRFEIRINQRTIDTLYQSQNDKPYYYQGTMAHELGHSLGLADNPQTNAESLMKYDRDRATITGPQLFDRDAVRENSLLFTLLPSTEEYYETDPIQHTDLDNYDNETLIRIYSDYPAYINMETLYDKADLVVVCEKEDLENYIMANKGSGGLELPYTITNFKIKNVLKGDNSLERVIVKQLGGIFDRVKYVSDNTEPFEFNITYLLFLETYDNTPATLLNPVQGMYYIDGSEIIAREKNVIDTSLYSLETIFPDKR